MVGLWCRCQKLAIPQRREAASKLLNRNTGGVKRKDVHGDADENRPNTEGFSLDSVFRILSNRRRREVLRYLEQHKGRTVTIDQLARHVAAKENDIEVAQLSSKQRKRAYVALHQNHLQMLDKLGVIDHDKDRGTVILRDVSPVSSYLSDQTAADRSYRSLYVAAGVGGLVTIGLLGIGPASAVPSVTWTLLSTTALIVIAIKQTLTD